MGQWILSPSSFFNHFILSALNHAEPSHSQYQCLSLMKIAAKPRISSCFQEKQFWLTSWRHITHLFLFFSHILTWTYQYTHVTSHISKYKLRLVRLCIRWWWTKAENLNMKRQHAVKDHIQSGAVKTASLMSLGVCNSGASNDGKEPSSLHQAVLTKTVLLRTLTIDAAEQTVVIGRWRALYQWTFNTYFNTYF